VGFDDGGPISGYIEARNLSDEAYISSTAIAANVKGVDTALFEPGNGRAVYGGVQVRW
jgi:iron complex outermembrane receptor protein